MKLTIPPPNKYGECDKDCCFHFFHFNRHQEVEWCDCRLGFGEDSKIDWDWDCHPGPRCPTGYEFEIPEKIVQEGP